MTARRVAWWLLVVTLAVATLAATSVGGWQLLIKSHQLPRIADESDARQEAIQAASTGTVKVLSYSPDTLDQDFDAATAVLTGEFLEYYKKFTSQTVRPAAQEKRVTTKADVQRAGVESLTRVAAKVLVFVKQTTSSNDQPKPTESTSSVRVGLAKVNGSWLIDHFDPV
jgi:Mce-associated membrane protein